MPKFVRRQPLSERIFASLNPYDFLLWLSEELESSGWDRIEKEWAFPIGVGLNLVFLIARSNTQSKSAGYDDVFGDGAGSSFFGWLVSEMLCKLVFADNHRLPSLSIFCHLSPLPTHSTPSGGGRTTVCLRARSITSHQRHPQDEFELTPPLLRPPRCSFYLPSLEPRQPNQEHIQTRPEMYGRLQSGTLFPSVCNSYATSALAMSLSTGFSYQRYLRIPDQASRS